MSRKTIFILGITLLLTLVCFGAYQVIRGKFALKPAASLAPIKVGLSWIHEAQFAGEYVADQKGLYRQQGLQVSLIPYSDEDLVSKLVSGEYQFAILQGDSLLQARSQGKPLVGVFVTYRVSPTMFYSKPELKINKITDFVNKKIGVAYSEKIPLLSMLKDAGIKSSQVKIVERDYIYEPLVKGVYDVEAGWVTDLDSVKKAGIENPSIIKASDYNANIFGDIITTTEDMIANHPELVRQFVTATTMGWDQAVANPDPSALLTQQYQSNLDPDHLKFVLKVSIPLIKPTTGTKIGTSAYVEWRRMYDILQQQGLLEKPFNVVNAYNSNFIE